ncbi:MAG: lipopolysaccharide heptosyltransferase I [Gammaproteobacteria bacterium GWF2_41_13]|nr:MAG: lipopolysaccharide heptosyltransferase I [Gammaproteobacteria bacterium GWF2_41_13]
MNILIVKTSSLGDLFHTLPALSDARKQIPDIHFDWVVEENFAEVPVWHPAVRRIIPVAIRRWRKSWWRCFTSGEWRQFKNQLRATNYDLIIDAQGLIKSALIAKLAKGSKVIGFDKNSVTESMARFFYGQQVFADLNQHAIVRMRWLFAEALGYSVPDTKPDYGLNIMQFIAADRSQQQSLYVSGLTRKSVLFLHGTTWSSKHWLDERWGQLADLFTREGFSVFMPWSNEQERRRAERLAKDHASVHVLPRTTLGEIAQVIAQAAAIVAMDTGLGNLAAALGKPIISLYGPTKISKIGIQGEHVITLAAPTNCVCCEKPRCKNKAFSSDCMAAISAEQVYTLIEPHIKTHSLK